MRAATPSCSACVPAHLRAHPARRSQAPRCEVVGQARQRAEQDRVALLWCQDHQQPLARQPFNARFSRWVPGVDRVGNVGSVSVLIYFSSAPSDPASSASVRMRPPDPRSTQRHAPWREGTKLPTQIRGPREPCDLGSECGGVACRDDQAVTSTRPSPTRVGRVRVASLTIAANPQLMASRSAFGEPSWREGRTRMLAAS